MNHNLNLSITERLLRYLGLAIVLFLALLFLMPLYWMLTGSFKIMSDTMSLPPEWIPRNPTLTNYDRLLFSNPAMRWTFNSVYMSTVVAGGAIVTSAMAGYAFGKKKFPGGTVLFWVMLMTMMLPNQVLVIPLFIMISDFGWINSYFGLIMPFICYPLGVFLVKQFMSSVPNTILEAGKIDGAGEIRLFVAIVVPMIKPAIAALGIFAFVASWNEYLWQLVVVDRTLMLTLPVAVSRLAYGLDTTNMGLAMAGATLAFIPMLIFFLIFQRYFIKGITIGAIKG